MFLQKILDAKGQTVDWGDGIMFAGHYPEYLCAMVKVPAFFGQGILVSCHPMGILTDGLMTISQDRQWKTSIYSTSIYMNENQSCDYGTMNEPPSLLTPPTLPPQLRERNLLDFPHAVARHHQGT